MDTLDTIYGEMTFPGRSALRVIRVSGDLARKSVERLFDSKISLVKNPKTAIRGKLLDLNGNVLDDSIAIFFKKPNSYNGEDIVEFHCHGSEGIIKALSTSLEFLGIRKAKNGEFSFRAFINGKISLKEAKRLKKIMEAQTSVESSSIFASQDLIEKQFISIKGEIIDLLAKWEARLDFPDEVPQENLKVWEKELTPLLKKISSLLEIAKRSKQVKEGFKVAIFGAPNSGKSSLFNNLLGRERAIVAPHPGTTRDTLEESLEIEGLKIIFIDMAGARKNSRSIEKMGIDRAVKVARNSDLVLFLFDGQKGWTNKDQDAFNLLKGKNIIKVATKQDLYKDKPFSKDVVKISNVTYWGTDSLLRKITSFFKSSYSPTPLLFLDPTELFVVEKVFSFIRQSIQSIKEKREEYATDFLKRALFEIDELYRTDSLEEIYDTIFKHFCIGK